MNADELELERLLNEAAPDEATRDALREAHRQMEKDLLRLADPLPPADFLNRVMAKVENAPTPVSRSDVAFAIGLVSAALFVAVAVAGSSSLGSFGVAMAQAVILLREGVVAVASVLSAVWKTAALPVSLSVTTMLAVSMVAVRRFASPSLVDQKVVS